MRRGVSALALAAAAGCADPEGDGPVPQEQAAPEPGVPITVLGLPWASPTTEELMRAEPRLAEEVAALTADTGVGVVNRLEGVARLDRPGVAELFPGWDFYRLTYSMEQTDPNVSFHLALGLGRTLAIDEDGFALRLTGSEAEFLALLDREGITVASDADARRVCLAFWDLNGLQTVLSEAVERVSANEWHVDLHRSKHVFGETESSRKVATWVRYYRLVTDARTQRVIAWEKAAEQGEPRVEVLGDPEAGGR